MRPKIFDRKGVVVLLSGGIDSTVMLYGLHDSGVKCYPLTLNYGQRHRIELRAAFAVCNAKDRALLIRLKIVRLPIGMLLKSALTGSSEIPKGSYTLETLAQTVVPNRNMILLSVAAGYAQSIGATSVAYAAHSGDHPLYPDCRPEFIAAMGHAIVLGTGSKVDLFTPFVDKTKEHIITVGSSLGVPFKLCYSCYEGGVKHCGKCSTCQERRKAFRLAGVDDPTTYED